MLITWIENHMYLIMYAGVFSFVLIIITAVSVPFIINSLPADYFLKEKRRSSIKTPLQAFLFIIVLIIKNSVGLILFLSGFIMLFIPGQGLLTIFISLLFIDFPGRWKLQKRAAGNRKISSALNWIRRKGGKEEFFI